MSSEFDHLQGALPDSTIARSTVTKYNHLESKIVLKLHTGLCR